MHVYMCMCTCKCTYACMYVRMYIWYPYVQTLKNCLPKHSTTDGQGGVIHVTLLVIEHVWLLAHPPLSTSHDGSQNVSLDGPWSAHTDPLGQTTSRHSVWGKCLHNIHVTCTGQLWSWSAKKKLIYHVFYSFSRISSCYYTFTIAMVTFYQKSLAKIQYFHKEHQYPRYLPCTSHSEKHFKMLILWLY